MTDPMLDVRVVEEMLDALTLCQHPASPDGCDEPTVDGTSYCRAHLEVMRARRMAELDCEDLLEPACDAPDCPLAAPLDDAAVERTAQELRAKTEADERSYTLMNAAEFVAVENEHAA